MRGAFVITLGSCVVVTSLFAGATSWNRSAAYAGVNPSIEGSTREHVRDDDDDDDDEEQEGKRNGVPKGKARGLLLTMEPANGSGPTDTRVARVAALYVPEGQPPSAFVPGGPFQATFEGELVIPFRTEANFTAEGRGEVDVQLNDKPALKANGEDFSKAAGKTIKLKKGLNKLVIKYEGPKAGDASLRLFWSSEDFDREPLPLVALVHDPKLPVALSGRKHREGRDLLATMRCLKCHTSEMASGGMPELGMDAPSMVDIGDRLNPGWMKAWIEDPKKLRPSATMPTMIHGEKREADARDIAAFLGQLTTAPASETQPSPGPEAATAGGRLFSQLGCVGCHTTPDRKDFAADPKRVPLHFVAAKWKPSALRAFLKQPDRHYAWIRMPKFGFSDAEAANLSAYLLANSAKTVSETAFLPGDADRGKQLIATTGCTNCHAVSGIAPAKFASLKEIPAEAWSKGCLDSASGAGRKAPDFALSDGQKQAIKGFVEAGLSSLTRDCPPEFAERQIKLLRCDSCHRRDGQDDMWSELKAETAGLIASGGAVEIDPDGHPYPAEEVRPALTWVGEKLKPEWMAAFIAGEIPNKPRPYLHARMPAFPIRAKGIADGLALEHGYPTVTPADAEPKADLAAIAKDQLVKTTGLGCASCHKMGPQAAVGVFEAPGINFALVKGRIRKPFYDRWIRGPLRVEPDTKMPSFFNNKKSTLPTVFDGDAEKQGEALWNFLLQGEKIGTGG